MNREKGIFKDEEEERDYLAERQRVIQELRYQHYQYSVQQIKKEMSQKIEREASRIGLTEQQRDALKVIQEEFKLHMDIELRGVENLLHFDKPESVQKFYQENGFETGVTKTGQNYVEVKNEKEYKELSAFVGTAAISIDKSNLPEEQKNKAIGEMGNNLGASAGNGVKNEGEKQAEILQNAGETMAVAMNATNSATGGEGDLKSPLENLKEKIPDFDTNPKYAEIRNSKLFTYILSQELMKNEYQEGKATIGQAIDFAKIDVVKTLARTEVSKAFINDMKEYEKMDMEEEHKKILIENAKQRYVEYLKEYCKEHNIKFDKSILVSLQHSQSIDEEVKKVIIEQINKETQTQENEVKNNVTIKI
ncbi:hypothetical protein ACLSZN_03295 [Avibacterium avium]|uniref:hypothetical protein n=2 Tax=Avibacterium avium TaxID=751 RepID=UPI003BF7F56B